MWILILMLYTMEGYSSITSIKVYSEKSCETLGKQWENVRRTYTCIGNKK